MAKTVSALWEHMPTDADDRLRQALTPVSAGKVFFRADDIGVPGPVFSRLLKTFARHDTPLALAVVPAWLTRRRWDVLKELSLPNANLWCWHQHGWRHQNHETVGKKQEFGPSRPLSAIVRDVTGGRQRLETIMGAVFQPIFTPPWNRCDPRTLDVLAENAFHAVSRFASPKNTGPLPLQDIPVNVDLHTRKNKDGRDDWNALIEELVDGLAQPVCGIMIHHQCMNAAAFAFLDILLARLNEYFAHRIVTLDSLATAQHG